MSNSRRPQAVDVRQPVQLDDTDRAIVAELREDGRLSMRALAEKLHISRASAYTRVERLVSEGVITGYTATIDPERYGFGISAYVYLKISQHSWKAVRRQVLQIPEVWHGALVSGENDLVLLVRTSDAASMRELVLNTFQTMPDVLATQTVLILDELSGPEKSL
ncbi:Lrp/AsnC family transcriptional regulator [Jatrophihabitans sp.]|uniref:Lrp/AsnC family transcriptional regulator n=1 Tax=Jatrophihabitans sp. TaxID=1932789 RepID=UPI002BDBC34A|nr:Lrp/AsnC family transcriptional regulator [Jatrophihabitans sp.]